MRHLYCRAMQLEVDFFTAQPYEPLGALPVALVATDFDDTMVHGETTEAIVQAAIAHAADTGASGKRPVQLGVKVAVLLLLLPRLELEACLEEHETGTQSPHANWGRLKCSGLNNALEQGGECGAVRCFQHPDAMMQLHTWSVGICARCPEK